MNEDVKNILSFIKETFELKNKNIYLLKNYEIHIDLGTFYNQFKELIETPNYSELDINSDSVIFKIKYIKDDAKKEIPKVPKELEKYIFINNNEEINSRIDNLEEVLKKEELIEKYKDFKLKLKEVNRYNSLIDLYNSKYMQFYNVYKRINDYEEKIEIIFGQKLLIWKSNENERIERYILEANLEMFVDPIKDIISLKINKEKFRGFVADFLNLESYKIKDKISFYNFIKNFNDEKIDTKVNLRDEVKKYINYISLENEIINRDYKEDDIVKALKTFIFNNSGIIIRNKHTKLWIEDLNKIIDMCDKTEFSSIILNMFNADFSNDKQVHELLDDKTYNKDSQEEILFPLPSNEEQYKIVDKVKSSNIVLVQGPPGTGKSHTIANLISYYISKGKKVIVTSEKSKALEVLRDKIPEKIRCLTLALLNEKGVDKELEYSIQTVLKEQQDERELDKTEKLIEKLYERLEEIHNKKQNVLHKIIEVMSIDTISHRREINEILNDETTNEWDLMNIAIWLEQNKQYRIISKSDLENYNYENPKKFFEKLDDICDEIKDKKLAISKEVPVNKYLQNNDIELYIRENLKYKNYKLHNLQLNSAIKQANLTNDIIDNLKIKIEELSYLYKFFEKEWIKSNINYDVFWDQVKDIKILIESNKDFIMNTEKELFDFSIKFSDESEKEIYQENIKNILELFDNNGKISILDKIKYNRYINNLKGLLYNEKTITKNNIKQKDLILIKNAIDYYILVDSINLKIKKVLNIDLFKILNIAINQFGKFKEKILNIFNALINFRTYVSEIEKDFNQVINTNLFKISYLDTKEETINYILDDLQYYITINSSENRNKEIIKEIREFYKNYKLQNLEDYLTAIERNKLDESISNKKELLYEINIINQYNNLKKSYLKIVEEKNNLISNYIYKFTFDERQFLKDNIDKILKYHYIEKYYLSLESKTSELPHLYEERKRLIKEEKNVISDLIATKGWYYQNKKMSYEISTSLNRWINLKKKLGRGTGKNANIYLRQMREEMNVAKNAIPVWIMPIDKLIEQYPFTNEPPFDILIMDESSQTSVLDVSALARAKKIIIVGDDKQISPTNSFTRIDEINDLRYKYLKNNIWDLQIAKDTSIYDIIQTICGNRKITLTEHFRCLPEIINYSNKEFYNMEINPLKIRGKENTIDKPIKTIYVPNATCKKIGAQIYNQNEIERIVDLVSEIREDEQYANKTIGIIALQNGSQRYIQKLTELIMQKFGENFIKERKIKIGTTYDFQGDERDVIILGMVVSSVLEDGEKYNFRALTTQEFDRSFNVAASRAREQMILVHSVKLDELSPNCNRFKLLSYCLNYDNEKEQEHEKLFESKFERDIYYCLSSKGYMLIPQFKVGKYRIDFIIKNNKNQNIAIECDGDRYHGIEQLGKDLERQSILERCGWKFARIRASEFYYDRDNSIKRLIDIIESYLNSNDALL